MANGRERSTEVWFEFDNVFNVQFGLVPEEVLAAYDAIPLAATRRGAGGRTVTPRRIRTPSEQR
jgi:hypothetical protein